jgi:hypothetical protein
MKGNGELSTLGKQMEGNANSVMNLPISNLELAEEPGYADNTNDNAINEQDNF